MVTCLHGDAAVKLRAGQFRRQARLDANGRDGDRRADTRQLLVQAARRRREGDRGGYHKCDAEEARHDQMMTTLGQRNHWEKPLERAAKIELS